MSGSERPSVGLIVNANASRDVRRLTSLARTVDVHERVNTAARILSGFLAAGLTDVRFMPEPCRVVERACDELAAMGTRTGGSEAFRPRPVGPAMALNAAGTAAAARAMAEAGVRCIVTLGGDGTNRAVVSGWPEATIVPLPGGTNNAFATPIEPTAAGLAAGLFAAAPERHAGFVRRAPRLEVRSEDGSATSALVDVAVVRGGWVGAHALWDPALLLEAVLARSDPAVSGLTGVAGMLHPLDGGRPRALHIRFGQPGRTVLGALGPGQLVPISVRRWRLLDAGEAVTCGPGPGLLALDGERELVLAPGRRAEVRLVPDGPGVLDATALLRQAARSGRFATPEVAGHPEGDP